MTSVVQEACLRLRDGAARKQRRAACSFSLVALLALVAWPQPAEGRFTQIVPAGAAFACTPVAVWDGDGPVWCAEGPKVRIAGVAAREMDGTCRVNQPCPVASAEDARDRLVRLFGGAKGRLPQGHVKVRSATMRCVSDGGAGGSRTAAWCVSPVFGDLSCALVRAGGVLRWPRYWREHRC